MSFKEVQLTNNAIEKLIHNQPVKLTVTMESTGAATAYIVGNQIIVTCVAALHANYVMLTTPINFRVLKATSIQQSGTSATITLRNADGTGSTDITDALTAGADKAIVYSTTIDDANYEFVIDDDDLILEIGAEAFTGIVIIDIAPVLG